MKTFIYKAYKSPFESLKKNLKRITQDILKNVKTV